MTELAVQSAAAFLAIFGFSIILDVPKKFLLYAGAAGGVCWFVYLLALQAGRSLIMTVFLVAGILPTVPGASVYRCVYFMIQGLADLSTYHLVQTIQIAGAMALAIFIVDSLFRLVQKT